MKAKRLFICCAALPIYFFGVCCAIEAYFRIFDPQPIRPAVYRIDPVYGLKMIPALKGYLKEREYLHTFRLNSLGFRDAERSKNKPEDTRRIIGLGDSFTWGVGVEENATFLKNVEEGLNRGSDGRHYEVFNWGVSAWGTDQQLLCLKYQVPAYDTDLVILQYFKGNDMMNNVYSSLFRLDDKGKPVYFRYGRQYIPKIKKITDYIPFYYRLTQHSHLVNFIRIRLLAGIERREEKEIDDTLVLDRFEYGSRLTEAILEEFFVTAAKNGIKVVMIVIPEKGEVSRASLKAGTAQHQKYLKEGLMIANVCRRNNIRLLDFSDIFTHREASIIYYGKDIHLTPYGHKVIAESIMRFFNEEHLL